GKPVKLYDPESSMTVWGRVTLGTSAVASVATFMLKGLGGGSLCSWRWCDESLELANLGATAPVATLECPLKPFSAKLQTLPNLAL
ncbi:hypothetical protein HAX54_003126, partial [Datura stramonium]|nr:hypothetical protein [Datura stramonium]